MPDLNAMVTLARVAEAKSFSEAARRNRSGIAHAKERWDRAAPTNGRTP